MRTVFYIYLFVINCIGFLIMGIDKRRARKNLWRVRERTLFLIALLLGSAGSLLGMYTFRHKTRHKRFTIGIPAILILQCALALYILLH